MQSEQVPGGQGPVVIRPMAPGDGSQVLVIYQAGLDGGQASFETRAPEWADFDAAKLPGHRHVAADPVTGQVLGWVAVSAVSSRRVYAGVVEHSVYVHPAHHGRGVGSALMEALIASTEAAGIWTIQGSIFPENGASFRLHQRAGFRVVGTRERVALHHGRWRDTVILERRSRLAGLDLGCKDQAATSSMRECSHLPSRSVRLAKTTGHRSGRSFMTSSPSSRRSPMTPP